MQKQHATPAQSGRNGAPRVVAPLVQRERSDQVAAIGLRTRHTTQTEFARRPRRGDQPVRARIVARSRFR